MTKKEQLVSIVVVTYNSAKYVLETLESAKNQTYKNIELIVSDDCSTDNTVEICEKWLSKNANRFVNTDIVTVAKNTGVSANCNRAIKNATSNWVKFMAGDDIFLPNCIEDNMNYVKNNKGALVTFSYIYKFIDIYDEEMKYERFPNNYPTNLMHKDFTANDQYKRLLLSDRITYTPSYFFNKKAILSVGGYDEDLKRIEDYPMWLKLTKSGIKLHFVDSVTVCYRQHEKALNNMSNYGLFKPQYISLEKIKKSFVYPYLPWDIVAKMKFIYTSNRLFDILKLNRKENLVLYKIVSIYLNPFQYINSFKKHILKLKKTNYFYSE